MPILLSLVESHAYANSKVEIENAKEGNDPRIY